MKKVLTLIAVSLMMTSVASAGLVWLEIYGVGTSGDVVAGSDITLNIVADTGVFNMMSANILATVGAASVPSSHALFTGAFDSDGFIQNNGVSLITGISLSCIMDFVTNVPAGEVLYSFTYTVPDAAGTSVDITAGNVNIAYNDWGEGTSMGAATLNIVPVPEPMMIALLGLGGLFLRRRK